MLTLMYHGYTQDELELLLQIISKALSNIRGKNCFTCLDSLELNCCDCFVKNVCHDLTKIQGFIQDLLYEMDIEHRNEILQNGE